MNIKNKLFIIFPVLFSVITFVITFSRTPFWDETHAFEIARLNFFEILYLARIEGHPILWYLILKPFSSLKLYPYSMFFINWMFCVLSIFVLWKKAPFNNLVKTLITFSTPFVFYFAPVARCYSIGILLLFLICACFRKRFKKPYLFSSLLLICSNTSLLTFIPCFYLWLVYLFQAFKRKSKIFKISFLFFVLNCFLFLIQFINFQKPYVANRDHHNFVGKLFSFVVIPNSEHFFTFLFHLVVFVLFYYSIYYLFKKSKYALYLMLSCNLTLTFLFYFIFSGSFWNYYFYFIYFIVLLWIFKRQIFANKIMKYLILAVFCFCTSPYILHSNGKFQYIYSSNSEQIVQYITKNLTIDENTKFYCLDWWSDISPASDIYFLKNGIDIYDIFGNKRTSFESIKDIFFYRVMVLDIEKFYQSLDTTKKNYIITDGTIFSMNKMQTETKFYLKYVLSSKKLNFGVFELVKK